MKRAFALSLAVPLILAWGWLPTYGKVFGVSVWALLAKRAFLGSRKRKGSIVTEVCARGTFPAKYNIPHSIIHGIFYMDKAPSEQAVRETLDKGLGVPKFNRLRSICTVHSTIDWHTAQNFDLKNHVRTLEVTSEEHLIATVEELLNVPMDFSKPLWEFVVIKNTGKGRSAVIPRIHHAVGDGISLVGLLLSIFSRADGSPFSIPVFDRGANKKVAHASMLSTAKASLSMAIKTFRAAIKVLALPLKGKDSPTAWRGPHTKVFEWSGRRKLIIFPTIPLALVKQIKDKVGGTVNDVMVGAFAGAIWRYINYRNDPLTKQALLKVRALCPFAFPRRASDRPGSALRNLWCFVSLPFPVGSSVSTPKSRLLAAKRTCDTMKELPEPYVQYGIQSALSHVLPVSVQGQIALDLMTSHSMVFTNVPGPAEQVFFAGEPLLDIHALVANVVPQVSILSYDGRMRTNIVVDDAIVTEPHKMAEFFLQEFQELAKELDLSLEEHKSNRA